LPIMVPRFATIKTVNIVKNISFATANAITKQQWLEYNRVYKKLNSNN